MGDLGGASDTHIQEFLADVGTRTQSLRRAARRLLCSSDLATLPIDIIVLGNECGLSVAADVEVLNDHLPMAVGGLVHQGKYFDTIVYNSLIPQEEQRFMIAHEIAEWYLGHEVKTLDKRMRHALAPRYEPEQRLELDEEVRSDIFGLELLCPAPLFFAELLRHGSDVPALAEIFQVTERLILFKFWINGLDPASIVPLEAARHFKEWIGPWGQLLQRRFYDDVPIEMTRNLPGLPVAGSYSERHARLRALLRRRRELAG